MRKGTGVVLAVFLVALVMGLATWPLLRIRRQKEIRRTELLLKVLDDACRKYEAAHGTFPSNLTGLIAPGEPLDAWRRPIRYGGFTMKRHGVEKDYVVVWSDGPDLTTTDDDIRLPSE